MSAKTSELYFTTYKAASKITILCSHVQPFGVQQAKNLFSSCKQLLIGHPTNHSASVAHLGICVHYCEHINWQSARVLLFLGC